MKAREAKLLDVLKQAPQFVIPIYQRHYSWTERECKQLWDDIVRCGSNDKIVVHFVGSIVYIESGLSHVTHYSPMLVIDGQQRLTTVSLILAALADAVGDEEPFDGFSKRKIKNYYLLNPEETDERHFKLILSKTDKESLKVIVDDGNPPQEPSLRITENHESFKKWIKESGVDLITVWKGLAKLVVVDLALNRDQDNPQLIFESMNSTGKELSQADLIRNYILMGLEPELQSKLYNEYWRPMELDFGQEAYGKYFDDFMRHYLTVKTGDIPKIQLVYEEFKNHALISKNNEIDDDSHVEGLVSDIRDYARYFCSMALGGESDPELKAAFNDLRELKVDVSYPLLLRLYHDHTVELLPKEDFICAVRLVEAYVFRRAICSIPTNSMNKTFSTFCKAINEDRYLESIKAHFVLLPSYRRFPRREEFHREFQQRDLYHFRSRSYWLRRFENYQRKEYVPVDEYTIEHIMPQNENLSEPWRDALGTEWELIQEKWLHTLGNLTLTGYNSEYSDRPFHEKRDMEGGFMQSPLKVNEGLGQIDSWNEEAIKKRADKLATLAVDIWDGPKLDEDTLAFYKPKIDKTEVYSIDDHPHLLSPNLKPIYEAFRKEVLELDPCVHEEFKKLYVAFKAETNFVDVVPRAKRMRLSLNMRFSEINDPKGLCRDITGLGKWGNGDVSVDLATMEDLPYVLGVVRQSLERQLGDTDDS